MKRLMTFLICLFALLLCLLLFGCTATENSPDGTDTAPDSNESDSPTPPETDQSGTSADTEEDTMPDMDTEPETARPAIEDPALNVYPTDGKYIDIGIFFEPDAAHTTPEHYDWIKAAHITYIDSVNWDPTITKEINYRQAELAAERGIRLSFYPRRFGVDIMSMSDKRIAAYCEELKAVSPSITDLHVIDEPANPWAYARVLRAVRAAGMTPRLNYLPQLAVEGIGQTYRGHIEDTVIAVGAENYPTLYFDHYPYVRGGSIPDMFYNMESVRVIGLKYDLPTGLYLQCFGDGGSRRPTAHEIRYQASAALAYGYKSLTYFTWWTTNPPENTHNYAVIAPDGSKTDLYDDVVAINGQITVTGALLSHLDALEIYHTEGSETGIQRRGKDELPLFPEASAGRSGFVVSLMEDRDTGRDYIMLVNKNFKKDTHATVTVTDAITHLYNCTNGSYEPIDISSGSFEVDMLPGGYVLLATGQHDRIVERRIDLGDNLAEGKPASTHAVNPGNGYYAYCVSDGIRDNSDKNALGFRSAESKGFVAIDLGRVTAVNRVDIYPTGSYYNKGANFPRSFTVEVSADGNDWVTVGSSDGIDATKAIPMFTFDKIDARYVRMKVTKGGASGGFEIAEMEVYCDDGQVPPPDAYPTEAPAIPSGTNVATADPNVLVLCSSAYQEGNLWKIAGINDGIRLQEAGPNQLGWSSNILVNSTQDGATEWIGYDLGFAQTVNAMNVYPAVHNGSPCGFPLSYCVEISEDGQNWTSILSVENDPEADSTEVHTLRFDTVTTRFIRFRGTRLVGVGGEPPVYGYMMQLSEVEVIIA